MRMAVFSTLATPVYTHVQYYTVLHCARVSYTKAAKVAAGEAPKDNGLLVRNANHVRREQEAKGVFEATGLDDALDAAGKALGVPGGSFTLFFEGRNEERGLGRVAFRWLLPPALDVG